EVHLLIDLFALVKIGAVVGEARLDLRIPERGERSVPQLRRGCSGGQRGDLIGIPAPQIAVDLQECGWQLAGIRGRRHLVLRRMLENFGDDATEKSIVDFDAASLLRLFEDVVDKTDFRLVSGLISRE